MTELVAAPGSTPVAYLLSPQMRKLWPAVALQWISATAFMSSGKLDRTGQDQALLILNR